MTLHAHALTHVRERAARGLPATVATLASDLDVSRADALTLLDALVLRGEAVSSLRGRVAHYRPAFDSPSHD